MTHLDSNSGKLAGRNDLGKAFASLDASPTKEPNLEKHFVWTRAITQIRERDRQDCILVGLKGIGKTAAFRSLTEFGQMPDVLVALSPENYALELRKSDLSAPSYSHEFEYEITLELLRKLKEVKPAGLPQRTLRDASQHLKIFAAAVAQLGGRIRSVSVLGSGLSISDPNVQTVSGLTAREDALKARTTLVNACEAGVRMLLVIDDPEVVFSSSGTVDSNLLGGLCLAVGTISSLSRNLKAILLMKSHVYSPVSAAVSDRDKFQNLVVRLWFSAEELKQVVAKRINFFCEEPNWQARLFGPSISAPSLEKIWGETLLPNLRNGPRDLVYWLSLACSRASEAGREFINEQDLQVTLPRASRESLETLGATYAETYPQLKKVLAAIFKTSARSVFTLRSLSSHIDNLLASDRDYQALHTIPWVAEQTSFSMPELLFRCGTLAIRDGGRWVFPYSPEYHEGTFEDADKVRLAPALVPAVGRAKKSEATRKGRGV